MYKIKNAGYGKNYEKEDEHDDPVGTHDTTAHREPDYIEYRNYE